MLHQFHDANPENMADGEYGRLIRSTIEACMVALWDIGDSPLVMLGASDIKQSLKPKDAG
jgi:hypothetical protein